MRLWQDDEEQDVMMTSMSFHQQGEVCVTARNDGVISVINCLSGMYVPNSHSADCFIAPFCRTDHGICFLRGLHC